MAAKIQSWIRFRPSWIWILGWWDCLIALEAKCITFSCNCSFGYNGYKILFFWIADKHSGGNEMKSVDEKGEDVVPTDKAKQLLEPRLDARQGVEDDVTSNPNYHPYPKPLAGYQDVLTDRKLFMETLGKLHSLMGTKFMIPVIGGKELELHQLFVQVTSRGGFEKVVEEKRWKEVTNVFNFPSTATNASFVLRKYYMSLLYHYEQIYFLDAKGWNSPSKTSLNTMSYTPCKSKKTVEYAVPSPETQVATRKKRKYNGEVPSTGLTLSVNQDLAGVIDGKFENGYFVTVAVGSTKLHGVLFHSSENAVQEVPVFLANTDNACSRAVRHQGHRKKLSCRDPTHPKPNRSGYNLFFAEQRAKLKLIHPGKAREISKTIRDLWNNLTDADKAVYQERVLKDKQKYQSELVVYKDGMRTGDVMSDAIPIRQHPIKADDTMDFVDTKIVEDEGDSSSSNEGDSGLQYGTDSNEEKSDGESELLGSRATGEPAIESATMVLNP